MAELHRTDTGYSLQNFPYGHLGHLSDDEENALEEFKRIITEHGLYSVGESGTPTHDNPLLLRFLRARRWNPNDALKQFEETEKWRAANHLETLYENIDIQDFEETRKLYPQWTGRRDKRGIPLYYYEVKNLNNKAMHAYSQSSKKTKTSTSSYLTTTTPPKLLRLFALYENLMNFVLPLCTAMQDRENPETPITQSNNIVDISGVGLMQFWNLRAHMQDASTLATAHYPETLDRIFIIGAPAFFPTVWGWIKKWFDPITVSKIFILSSHEVLPVLSSMIDMENIPKKFGGNLEFRFGDMPNLEDSIQRQFNWENPNAAKHGNTFPIGPLKLCREDEGELKAFAFGSIDGTERRGTIFTMKASTPDIPVEQPEPLKTCQQSKEAIILDHQGGIVEIGKEDKVKEITEKANPHQHSGLDYETQKPMAESMVHEMEKLKIDGNEQTVLPVSTIHVQS